MVRIDRLPLETRLNVAVNLIGSRSLREVFYACDTCFDSIRFSATVRNVFELISLFKHETKSWKNNWIVFGKFQIVLAIWIAVKIFLIIENYFPRDLNYSI